MTEENTEANNFNLRMLAEEKVAESTGLTSRGKDMDAQKLLHELQVHQIELEMQNENLRLAQTQAESAMEAYKMLYDFAPVGYLTINNQGYIEDINLTAAAMLGVERSLIVKQLFSKYFLSSYSLNQHLQQVHRQANNVVSDLKIRRANGESLDIQLESRMSIDENGFQSNIRSIMTDISARKSLELEVQIKQAEMESMLKQQIAALTASAIAHELNQPLASITAYCEVALHTITHKPEDTENLQKVLKNNIAQSQRAGKFLHDMIALLENVKIDLSPMDIGNCLNRAISAIRRMGYDQVEIDLFLEQDIPLVLGNPLQIEKVFINLFLNSIEAVKFKKGFAGNSNVKVIIKNAENMVNVTVQDVGPGFDEESLNYIFTPFYSTKEIFGLGLTISRSIIEACGGKLWVDKNTNSGATFHFTLPLAPELKI